MCACIRLILHTCFLKFRANFFLLCPFVSFNNDAIFKYKSVDSIKFDACSCMIFIKSRIFSKIL
eukprot:UN03903